MTLIIGRSTAVVVMITDDAFSLNNVGWQLLIMTVR
jgi:hypothetical protein